MGASSIRLFSVLAVLSTCTAFRTGLQWVAAAWFAVQLTARLDGLSILLIGSCAIAAIAAWPVGKWVAHSKNKKRLLLLAHFGAGIITFVLSIAGVDAAGSATAFASFPAFWLLQGAVPQPPFFCSYRLA